MDSLVIIKGTVAAIDEEKRDLTVLTTTPRGKAVKATVHMWKTSADGDDPAWANREDWRGRYTVGSLIYVEGWLGNNGRVIACRSKTTPVEDVENDDPAEFENDEEIH